MPSLGVLGLSGGCDVDGLFKIGAFQRVGFVEYRQRLEPSRGDHPFEGELAAWNIVFDEDVAILHPRDALGGRAEFLPVIGANDPAAGGGIERLQNAGEPNTRDKGFGTCLGKPQPAKLRHQHSGCSKTFSRQQLVSRRASRFGRMKAQVPEAFRGLSGHARRPVAHGEDSIKRSACGQRFDTRLRILETNRCGIVSPRILQDVAAVRRQHQFHVERASGLGKLADLITRGRGDQQVSAS